MVGLMQIMIYLLCVYLVFKGVEIFQIALCGEQSNARKVGIVIGILMIGFSILVAGVAFAMTESMAASIGDRMNNLPR